MVYSLNSLKYYGEFEEREVNEVVREKEFLQNAFMLILEQFEKKPYTRRIEFKFDISQETRQSSSLSCFVNGLPTSFSCNELFKYIELQTLWFLLNSESAYALKFLDNENRFKIETEGTDNHFRISFLDTQFLSIHTLSEIKTYNGEFLTFIRAALKHKKNFIVSGNTGSGKTSLLNILLEEQTNQFYAIVDNANVELKFKNNGFIRTDSNSFHLPLIHKSFLGMNADYYIFDDINHGLSFEHFQPFIATIHGSNPESTLKRLQNLHMQTGNLLDTSQMMLDTKLIDFIIQISYLKNGTVRIKGVSEVLGMGKYGILVNNSRVYSHNLDKKYLIVEKDTDERKFYTQEIFSYDYDTDILSRTDWVHEFF